MDWESILFENIVIVQTDPLDEIYKKHKFPVIMVEEFKDINESMLRYWYNQYKDIVAVNNEETFAKLQMDYWIKYIRNETNS